jgi:hypothetical protein
VRPRRHAGLAEPVPVAGQHVAPVRCDVGLGEHHGDRGADLGHPPQQRQLGVGEPTGGRGDDQGRVRLGQRGERRLGACRLQVVDAGRVDEDQAAGEQPAGDGDLGPQVGRPIRTGPTTHPGGDLLDRDGQPVRAGPAHHGGRRRFGVLHDGGHERGDIVAHRADRGVDERVDQLTLALARRAEDEDPQLRVE